MKKKTPIIITTLLATLLLSSYFAIAAEYGSKDDPLVSLSYIEEIILPKTTEMIDEVIEEKTQGYTDNIYQILEDIGADYNALANNEEFIQKVADSVEVSTSNVVSVEAGQVITLKAGGEILLRSGNVSTSSSAFLNVTSGSDVATNTALTANNLYMATDNDQTLTVVTSGTVIVIGTYIIG